ncbi:hypothetical protein EVAR_22479_1 [Eumeta japonica]|uniref:Uncharacterized protein n=1 Tax=Eumeta variegata TaxID=151549 RepID=A0A4C1VDJ7_EUMVA|nr:hypothetical protein EVAR_22479_1 [Eumeta japonica]
MTKIGITTATAIAEPGSDPTMEPELTSITNRSTGAGLTAVVRIPVANSSITPQHLSIKYSTQEVGNGLVTLLLRMFKCSGDRLYSGGLHACLPFENSIKKSLTTIAIKFHKMAHWAKLKIS